MKKWIISSANLARYNADPWLFEDTSVEEAVSSWLEDACPGIMSRFMGGLVGTFGAFASTFAGNLLSLVISPFASIGKKGAVKAATLAASADGVKVAKMLPSHFIDKVSGKVAVMSKNVISKDFADKLAFNNSSTAIKALAAKVSKFNVGQKLDYAWIAGGTALDLSECTEQRTPVMRRKVGNWPLFESAPKIAADYNLLLSSIIGYSAKDPVDAEALSKLPRDKDEELGAVVISFDRLVYIYMMLTCAYNYHKQKESVDSLNTERLTAIKAMKQVTAHVIMAMGLMQVSEISTLSRKTWVPMRYVKAWGAATGFSSGIQDAMDELGFTSSEALQSFGAVTAGGLGAKVVAKVATRYGFARGRRVASALTGAGLAIARFSVPRAVDVIETDPLTTVDKTRDLLDQALNRSVWDMIGLSGSSPSRKGEGK